MENQMELEEIFDFISLIDEILVLAINLALMAGQKFDIDALKWIDSINFLPGTMRMQS